MAWVDVPITTLTTIEAADLTQMHANATVLRNNMAGRAVATSPLQLTYTRTAEERVRFLFAIGSYVFYSGWVVITSWSPIPGPLLNRDIRNVQEGVSELVVTAESYAFGTVVQHELARLSLLKTDDSRYVSFFAEIKLGGIRGLTVVSSAFATI